MQPPSLGPTERDPRAASHQIVVHGSAGQSDAGLRVGALRESLPLGEEIGPHPLARAGVDVHALLRAADDMLVDRATPGTASLTDLLERARSALVRGAPHDALTALDAGWQGASKTEGGWYYRAAALALLGLPRDAERVLRDALQLREGSVALRFLLSVVLGARGNAEGAAEALAELLRQRPQEPVLLAWSAVLCARRGNRTQAQQLFGALCGLDASEALLSWTRHSMSSAQAAATRHAFGFTAAPTPPLGIPVQIAEEPSPRAPLQGAMHSLGALIPSVGQEALQTELRILLKALASNGTLQGQARPEQLSSARAIVAELLALLADEQVEHPSRPTRAPLRPSSVDGGALADAVRREYRELFAQLRAGRVAEAALMLDRSASQFPATSSGLLRTIIEGAGYGRADLLEPTLAEGLLDRVLTVRPDVLLTPVRAGLALLESASPRAEAVAATPPFGAANVGEQLAASERLAAMRRARATSRGNDLVWAVVLVVLASGAYSLGLGWLACGIIGAALWLALREQ